jgi:hypothetical protein
LGVGTFELAGTEAKIALLEGRSRRTARGDPQLLAAHLQQICGVTILEHLPVLLDLLPRATSLVVIGSRKRQHCTSEKDGQP